MSNSFATIAIVDNSWKQRRRAEKAREVVELMIRRWSEKSYGFKNGCTWEKKFTCMENRRRSRRRRRRKRKKGVILQLWIDERDRRRGKKRKT